MKHHLLKMYMKFENAEKSFVLSKISTFQRNCTECPIIYAIDSLNVFHCC